MTSKRSQEEKCFVRTEVMLAKVTGEKVENSNLRDAIVRVSGHTSTNILEKKVLSAFYLKENCFPKPGRLSCFLPTALGLKFLRD